MPSAVTDSEKIDMLLQGQKVLERLAATEATILSEVRGVKADVERVEAVLNGTGDGKSGLVARVVALEHGSAERAAERTEKAAERIEKGRNSTAVIAAVIAAIAAVTAGGLAAYAEMHKTPDSIVVPEKTR